MSAALEPDEVQEITVGQIFKRATEIAQSQSSNAVGVNHVFAAYLELGCETFFDDTANINRRVPVELNTKEFFIALTGKSILTLANIPDGTPTHLPLSSEVERLQKILNWTAEHYPNKKEGTNGPTPMHVLLAISKMLTSHPKNTPMKTGKLNLLKRSTTKNSSRPGVRIGGDLEICRKALIGQEILAGTLQNLILSSYYRVEPNEPPSAGIAAIVQSPNGPTGNGSTLSLVTATPLP